REVLRKGAKMSLRRRSVNSLRLLRAVVEDLSGSDLPTPEPAHIHRQLDAGAFAREFLTIDKPFVRRAAELAGLDRFPTEPAGAAKGGSMWAAMTLSGLGGSGKSALLTRFLNEVFRDKSATLVIFDFDRPGIDAADTVWLRSELARQIGLQYP